jgi:hypothetical protein
MELVPRMVGVAIVALACAASTSPALADAATPDNDSSVALPTLLLPSAQDPLLPNGLGPQSQMISLLNGRLDFFSVRPESRSTDFTSLLGGGTGGGGGLKLQFNW